MARGHEWNSRDLRCRRQAEKYKITVNVAGKARGRITFLRLKSLEFSLADLFSIQVRTLRDAMLLNLPRNNNSLDFKRIKTL